VANYSDIRYIAQAKDSTIYIAADNDFGFLKTDSTGQKVYESLAPMVRETLGEFGEVWQILFIDSFVYFQTYVGIIRWDGEKVKIIDIEESYIFSIDNKLYGSNFLTFDFGPIINDNIQPIKDFVLEDIVYQTFPLRNGNHLVITSEYGMSIFNSTDQSVLPFENEANEFLKKHAFYDGIKLREDLFAFGTWEGGMIFLNDEGTILKTIDKSSGLPVSMIHHIILGNNNNLWLGTSDGIAQLKLNGIPEIEWIDQEPEPGTSFVTEIIGISEDEFHHLHYQYPEDTAVILPFSSTQFNVEFYYTNTKKTGENITYSTKLDGYSDTWSSWDTSTDKTYANIGAGTFNFLVRSKDEQGMESAVTSFAFEVEIPWFLVFGRYLAILATIGLVSFIFIQVRTLRLRQRNILLEKIVSDRTKELLSNQKNLENSNKELISANHELDNFVYHTSHDLKAPLKSVLGLVSLSKKETSTNENLALYLEMIEKSVYKLEEFIQSVIEYSINSKATVIQEEIDFEKLIDASIEQLKEFEGMQEMKISKKIAMDAPFFSDPKRLSIVFNNIISNAIKYKDSTKPEAFLDISINKVNGSLSMSFKDNGCGISEKHISGIFDMFTRASETSSGSGLGLYIVHGTVQRLGGSISVVSTLGIGSEFKIEIPDHA
jgi:signal transduction histidine kinase